jgi:CDP-glucose 4,6-dehydratase
MVMDASFWKNKTVLLTGHTGFKGSWLALWLQTLGAKVVGYALPAATNPDLFSLTSLSANMTSHMGDIRDFTALHKVIAQEQPDIVFHLAAQALVRHSYINPVETYATNVMGTVNLLEALRETSCARVVVVVTSDKCYENREQLSGYQETEPMGGRDPYSSSKGCAELVTAAYRHSYFTQQAQRPLYLASARAGNVIGGGDWAADRLIPDFMRAIMQRDSLKVRNPDSIRPWQHVLEPLSGYLMLAERLWLEGDEFADGWNFGPEEQDAKPVSWIADTLTRLWGEGASWELDKRDDQPHEARYLKLDISKARLQLQWQPRWSLETALQKVMLDQIADYQAS